MKGPTPLPDLDPDKTQDELEYPWSSQETTDTAGENDTPERLKLEPNSKSKPELDDKPEPRADPEEPKLESKNRESHAGFEET
ncbi:hypothetical protein CTheo_858 [Ceratobasidium theobromae]|uniref:Uncharacterized protein n=1 Tax=Ceratobasidium theobromae TaxID=1582974 RepID=A0A5N5QV47_9AGAM|nr:hypothetical protein CTheo_858 [Ceratobasidium theobromae]